MREGDAVQLGPRREDPLLSDEAVVVALAAVFVLNVGNTLIRPLGLIVVVGHALQAGPLARAQQMGASGQVGIQERHPSLSAPHLPSVEVSPPLPFPSHL